MNEKLVDVKVEINKKHIAKLEKIEKELVDLIAKTENIELMDKYFDFQDQRDKCNEAYLATVKAIVE